jgi:serine/threonine protein kinase
LSPAIVQEFWTKCVLNLFDGLEFFQKNGLIHYDLKPHNILFNEKKMQMRYIDFGLMMNMESFMNTSKENNNPLAIMHWSYPWANAFANADTFNKYVESSEVEKADYTRDFTNLIVDGKKSIDLYLLGLDINHPSALNHVFDYIYTKEEMRKMVHDMSLYKTHISLKVDEFFQGLERFSTIPVEPHFVDTNKQGETVNLKFIVMVGASIDIYGLGFTLQYVLNNFYEKKLIKKSFYDDFTKLFATMYETDITKQQLSATFLKRRYAEMVKKRTYWS